MISVILPNYNHASFLKQRIDSILNQTYQDFELIVLDDCSTDRSREILETLRNNSKVSHILYNEKNSGSPFKQWQKGINIAKGDWIWIAESDDYCRLNFLERLLSFGRMNSEIGIVYAQTEDVDEKGNPFLNRIKYTDCFAPNIWERDFVLSGEEFVRRYMKVKNVIPNASGVIFKRSLITKEIFSEKLLDMKIAGDWLFWIQIALKCRVGFCGERLNFFRDHKGVTRTHDSDVKRFRRVMEEKSIRLFLKKKMNLNQDDEWEALYKRWFSNKHFRNVFKRNFYLPKFQEHSILRYLLFFLKQNLNK